MATDVSSFMERRFVSIYFACVSEKFLKEKVRANEVALWLKVLATKSVTQV